MAVSADGVLSGIADTGSAGADIPLVVRVTDSDGLGDVFSATIDVPLSPPSDVVLLDTPSDHGHSVGLAWALSAQDSYISHYNVYRSRNPEPGETLVLADFDTIADIIAAEEYARLLVGTVPAGMGHYTDDAVPLNGVDYYYWVAAAGAGAESAKIAASRPLAVEQYPAAFALSEPYPNPFNPSTALNISLVSETRLSASVYNITGQLVETLADGIFSAGIERLVWHAENFPAGVYFVRVRAQGVSETRKMLLLK